MSDAVTQAPEQFANQAGMAFAYTVLTGHMVTRTFAEFHEGAEALLGRPIPAHEFGNLRTWEEMRRVLGDRLLGRAQALAAALK